MPKLFRVLREEMAERDIDQTMLGKELDMTSKSISNRMTGAQEWSLDECYQVLHYLGLPDSDIYRVFPPGGRYVSAEERERFYIPEEDRGKIAAALGPLVHIFGLGA